MHLTDCHALGINATEEAFYTIHIKSDFADYVNHEDNQSESDTDDGVSLNENPADGYTSETDLNDITESKTIFQSMEHLDLKDCSKTPKNNRSLLEITLKTGKTMTVKKSTLCWFFTENKSRLSTDRLNRVKSMGSQKTKPTHSNSQKLSQKRMKKSRKHCIKPKNKRSKLIEDSEEEQVEESETETEDDYFSECESSGGEYVAEKSNSDSEAPQKPQIAIEEEKYYAVYYDDRWYVGRVINIQEATCQIKFLYRNLDSFNWPKQEDVQQVKKGYIFYGPISLLGLSPFNLKRHDLCEIEKKYKLLKKKLVIKHNL